MSLAAAPRLPREARYCVAVKKQIKKNKSATAFVCRHVCTHRAIDFGAAHLRNYPLFPKNLAVMPTRVAPLPAPVTPPRRGSSSVRLGLLSDSSPSTPRARRRTAGRVLPVTPGPATRALDILLHTAGNERCADCKNDAPRWASVRHQQQRIAPYAPAPRAHRACSLTPSSCPTPLSPLSHRLLPGLLRHIHLHYVRGGPPRPRRWRLVCPQPYDGPLERVAARIAPARRQRPHAPLLALPRVERSASARPPPDTRGTPIHGVHQRARGAGARRGRRWRGRRWGRVPGATAEC